MPLTEHELHVSTYTALGRFVTRYAGLLWNAEWSATHMIVPFPTEDVTAFRRVRASWGERMGKQILDAYFYVFAETWRDTITKGDEKILTAMRKEAGDLTNLRNRLLHDSYLFSIPENKEVRPLVRSRVRASKDGVDWEHTPTPPADIDALTVRVITLDQSMTAAVYHLIEDRALGPQLANRLEIRADGYVYRKDRSGVGEIHAP